MAHTFKTVGIMGKHRSYDIAGALSILVEFLSSQKINIVIEADTARSLSKKYNLPVFSRQQIGGQCDLIIVIGGDGSLLQAARTVAPYGTPIIGINRGRLGFLTDILPTEIPEKIGAVLAGHYQEEQRFLLHTDIIDQNNMLADADALNDVVLLPGDTAQMIEFEIYIDKHFVCTHRSDGLIVSTPTGSTAYALSGGGPILHPQLDAIVLVPVCPHTLSNRPLVVNGNSTVDIIISEINQSSPRISCDGQTRIPVPPGGRVFIRKKPEQLSLIHPVDHDYYETLRSKLNWITHT